MLLGILNAQASGDARIPLWVVVSSTNFMRTSETGFSDWSSSNADVKYPSTLLYADGLYLVGGRGDNFGEVSTSEDAVEWTPRTIPFGGNHVYASAYGNGTWVIGGAATYVGGSNVSAANGILLSETNNAVFQTNADDTLYCISDTVGAVVKVVEVK
jgi:hypothetical protein